jgi:uncharacterized protein
MQRIDHTLLSPSLGRCATLTSLHFGVQGSGQKVYIQASLHAEELPGMLTAHHLRPLLKAAEAAGLLRGEVVLVPVANPIGLAQRLDHKPMGRFELNTSENFNRHYPDLAHAIWAEVREQLGSDAAVNVAVVRGAIARFLQDWAPATELQSLRKTLLTLSHDADIVLDLHCDSESVMHFYCEEACWPTLEPVARFMGSEAILLARDSGGGPIDECLSGVWWRLAEKLQAEGLNHPLPQACNTTTLELRGEQDVSHNLARQDAGAIYAYLQHIGLIHSATPPAPPSLRCQPTPLAGSETLHAPVPGVVVFAAEPGQHLRAGDMVAEIVDPLSDQVTEVRAGVEGVFYARIRARYATTGCELGKIAGAKAYRTGQLLGN